VGYILHGLYSIGYDLIPRVLSTSRADSEARESQNRQKKRGRRKVKSKTRSSWEQHFSKVVPNGLTCSGS